jgi:hypothetical protein
VLPGLRTSIPNFELNEGPTCNKLTAADGSQECYIIYTRTPSYLSSLLKLAIETAGVKSGEDMYLIGYTSLPNTFDKNLPIAEQMMTSFKGNG